MAIPILKNQIQQIINQKAEDDFTEWIRQDIQEIETLKRKFSSSQKHAFKELDRLLSEVKSLLFMIIQSTSRTQALELITKLNSTLTELQKAENSFHSLSKSTQRALRSTCEDLTEYINDYQPDLDEAKIYREIINSPGFQVTLPGMGPTLISPKEIERRFNVRGFIREQISNITIHEKDEMINSCQDLGVNPLPEFRSELQPLAADLINHLSQLGLRQSREIDRLTKNLREILNLELEIEISAPETSQDLILAEIITLCDQPHLSHRLIQLGAQLGYSHEQLTRMAYPELCRFLRGHFNL